MLHLYIIEGCECWLTKTTGDKLVARIEADKREAEWERNGWKVVREAREAWLASGDPADWDFYSDIHKDYYGFRPHF